MNKLKLTVFSVMLFAASSFVAMDQNEEFGNSLDAHRKRVEANLLRGVMRATVSLKVFDFVGNPAERMEQRIVRQAIYREWSRQINEHIVNAGKASILMIEDKKD